MRLSHASRLRPDASLRVGTRGSQLARRQASIVLEAIRRIDPEVQCQAEIIRTQGDESAEMEVWRPGEQGVFVRRIEAALLQGTIDLAVHSFKDMPSVPSDGLTVAAFLARADPRDALVGPSGVRLRDLPSGATIGTGSARRRALLLDLRPDLEVRPIRGNVDTRLRRVAEGEVVGVVLAAAGLWRLGQAERICELLDPGVFVPAVGQGILAVQVRSDDVRTQELVRAMDDPLTRICALAERAVATQVGAGCQAPIGAYARLVGQRLVIDACIGLDGGRAVHRVHQDGDPSQARELGAAVGQRLLAGARGQGTDQGTGDRGQGTGGRA